MVLVPKSDNFDCETTVKDYLMSQNEDVSLDEIFGRDPNIGHETDEAPIDIDWWFSDQLHELTKPDLQK